MAEIILPRMDEDIDESSIIFWHKQEGDIIEKGDIVVEVQTEKAVSEIEAEADGVLEKIIVKRGEVASVGDVLGVIGAGEENVPSSTKPASDATAVKAKQEARQAFVRIPPRLRRLAKDLKVDVAEVQGTGKDGRLTETDIRQFAKQRESAVDREQGG